MSLMLSNEEKKKLTYERQNAVRNAWKEEKIRVVAGCGTRNWSKSEQEELIQRGSVLGYEGHHMKSVSLYPEYAGNPKNIQFLSEDEHLYGAHQGNYHYATNGYYDPETKEMLEFSGEELGVIPVVELDGFRSDSDVYEIQAARDIYYQDYIENLQNEYEAHSIIEDPRNIYEAAGCFEDTHSNSVNHNESSSINNGISR